MEAQMRPEYCVRVACGRRQDSGSVVRNPFAPRCTAIARSDRRERAEEVHPDGLVAWQSARGFTTGFARMSAVDQRQKFESLSAAGAPPLAGGSILEEQLTAEAQALLARHQLNCLRELSVVAALNRPRQTPRECAAFVAGIRVRHSDIPSCRPFMGNREAQGLPVQPTRN
jgi:hypothetical protein